MGLTLEPRKLNGREMKRKRVAERQRIYRAKKKLKESAEEEISEENEVVNNNVQDITESKQGTSEISITKEFKTSYVHVSDEELSEIKEKIEELNKKIIAIQQESRERRDMVKLI